MPVVPPVSNTYVGRFAHAFGTQRRTGPPRSHSSSKCPKRVRSANDFTSLRGSHPAFLAHSSQKGVPVSGEKCHCTISRTWASNVWLALLTASGETGAV